MKSIRVQDLKRHLQVYLRDVERGEIVLVVDGGRVIAELRQASATIQADVGHRPLAELVAPGLIHPGLPQDARAYRPSPLRRTVASSDLLDADRGER